MTDRPGGRGLIVGVALMLAALVAAYWYLSPYMAVHSMQRAADHHNADAFNDLADYPALRESIKGQISAKMSESMSQDTSNPFAALGTMIGMAMADRMIDAIVRPETVMRAMETGRLRADAGSDQRDGSDQRKVHWSYERSSVDRLIATPKSEDGPDIKAPSFVFYRRGFADWRLTEIRLPADDVQ
jgi:hypothetical protein